MSRFMMQSTRWPIRPLTFSDSGASTDVLVSASTNWAGIPFEVHDVPESAEISARPAGREQGMMISVRGTQTWVMRDAHGERTLKLQPGMLGFADADLQLRVVRTIGTTRVVVLNLHGYWKHLLDGARPCQASTQLPIVPSQTALSLALTMISEVESGTPSGGMFAESLSHALLHYVAARAPLSSVRVRGRMSDQARRKIVCHIDDNLHEDLRISDLAALTGLQPRHFSTLFRNAFGVTPHRYLIERRLSRASQLLATTGLGITEIALSLGFASQSHFSTAFSKRFGSSPSSYVRRRHRDVAGA